MGAGVCQRMNNGLTDGADGSAVSVNPLSRRPSVDKLDKQLEFQRIFPPKKREGWQNRIQRHLWKPLIR